MAVRAEALPVDLTTALQRRRDTLAAAWYRAVAGPNLGFVAPQEAHHHFERLTDRLLSTIAEGSTIAADAKAIGAELAGAHYLEANVIGKSLNILYRRLPEGLTADQQEQLMPRLHTALSSLAGGYYAEARTLILEEQEAIHSALVTELRTTHYALRDAHDRLTARVQERTDELAMTHNLLREENQRRRHAEIAYQALVENSLQGLVIIQDGYLVFANKELAEMTGYNLDELGSLDAKSLTRLMVVPEDIPRLLAYLEQPPEIKHFEYQGLRKDGTRYWVEVLASRIGFSGAPAVQAVLRDITERKQAEEERRRSEERYRQLLELTPDFVLAHVNGTITYANQVAARLLGQETPEALIGQSALSFTHPDYREEHRRRLHKVAQGESLPPMETRLTLPDGEGVVDLELRTVLIDYEGRPTVLVVGRDITLRKQAESALRQARDRLETRVQERTFELAEANKALKAEIAERRRAEEQVRERNAQLDFLNDANRAFTASLALDEVLRVILERLRESMDAQAWMISLFDRDDNTDIASPTISDAGSQVQGMVGWALKESQGICFAPLSDAESFRRDMAALAATETRSVITVPLKAKDQVIGVIELVDTEPEKFTTTDREFLRSLAAPAAIAIENARLYEAAQREIAERRRAESALRESEARYRTLIDASPDAIMVTDLEGQITMTNRYALDKLGLSQPTEMLGRNIIDEFIVSDERAAARRSFKKATAQGGIQGVEHKLQRADGTRLPVEVSTTVLRDAHGVPQGMIGIARDLTTRKRMEDALRRSNAELKALNTIAVYTSQSEELEGLLRTALETSLDLIGAELAWAHLEADQETQEPIAVLVPRSPSRANSERNLLQTTITDAVLVNGAAVAVEGPSSLEIRPGRVLPQVPTSGLVGVGLPIRARQRTIGVLGIVGDNLTEEDLSFLDAVVRRVSIAAENAALSRTVAEITLLRQIDTLRSELIANFSHDLKTPLGVIKFSCTSLLRDDVDFDKATQLELLEEIDDQADRLEHIVERVLELGRLESDELQLHREPFDLAALTRTTIASMRRGLHRHTIRQDFDPPSLIASVDGRRIEEVLLNLLDNAVKYSPDGGVIHVRGRQEGSHILFSVADCGIGIPEEDLERVFERFYRVDNDLKYHTAGVGLGLPVCRGIIEAHGGRIWAESQLGEGTIVKFTLPILSDGQMLADLECSPTT